MSCLIDPAVTVVTEIAKHLITPVARQFGYAFFYQSNVGSLTKEIRTLREARDDVHSKRNTAFCNGEIIKKEVEDWLENAKTDQVKAEVLLKDWGSKRKSCFYGWIPNPKTRYLIGRKAKKTALALRELRGQGKFEIVARPELPEGVVTDASSAAAVDYEEVFESRASLLKDIMEALVDESIGVVGVHGMGGIGKTTLMKHVNNQAKEKKLFGEVVMASVSEIPDIKRIQGEIAEKLGLKFNEETVDGRATRLCRRLKSAQKKKVLIILDDLWEQLNLEKVGIPRDKGIKLLFASRSQHVLSNVMNSDTVFHVERLTDVEAWKLFAKIAGNIKDDPNMKVMSQEVVAKCTGLPILLKALAIALKNSNPSQWEDTLEQLRRSKDVHSNLELSFKHLESDELRTLFLIIALFGTSRIPIQYLLKITMGLGLFGGLNTIKKARDRLNALLRSLQASSLLLKDNEDEYVKIHDMFREVALTIASRDWHALVMHNEYNPDEWSKEKLIKSRVMSLLNIEVDELPAELKCPELKMFLFYAEGETSKVPDSFFEGMRELKVLDFTSLCFTTLPSSVQFIENLRTLCIEWCSVEDVTIIGKLKQLQILSFAFSDISYLPKEISQLSELRLLDLRHCSKLEKIEPSTLRNLIHLEELYMENSFVKWESAEAEQRNNARIAELNYMPELTTLDILIPDADALPRDLPFEKLIKYRIYIGDAWDWSGDHKELRTLKLKLDFSLNILLDSSVQATLVRTQDLYLDGLEGVEKSINELCIEGFQDLKHLHMQNSPLINCVVRSTKLLQCTAFTILESLFLENLQNLKSVYYGRVSPESFGNLRVIKVKKCANLKNLFSFSLVGNLAQLEEIEISECEKMQEVVTNAGRENNELQSTFEMPNLRILTLKCLQEMRSFCDKAHELPLIHTRTSADSVSDSEFDVPEVLFYGEQVSFPRLESLMLSELSNIKELWQCQLPVELQNLQSLEVKNCENLSSVINSDMSMKLHKLQQLTIESCGALKQVFDLQELKVSRDVRVLPQLNEMKLIELPELMCIWNQNPLEVLTFQNLKLLEVRECNNLGHLFSFPAAKALQQVGQVVISECGQMEKIIYGEEGQVAELVFPALKSLCLEKMPNLVTFAQGDCSIILPLLKDLSIKQCPKMKAFTMANQDCLIQSEGGDAFTDNNVIISSIPFFNQKVFLPKLEELVLSSVDSFEEIWQGESFRQLTNMHVEECKNLMTVFPHSLTERLENLKHVLIHKCPLLEVIFGFTTEENAKAVLMLRDLEYLDLNDLPKLKHLSEANSHVAVAFPSLKEMSINLCNSLMHCFSSATARNLQKLELLRLQDCCSIVEVIVTGRGEEEEMMEPILFPRLHSLELLNLSTLIRLSSGSCLFSFPSLVKLEITGCKNMETLVARPSSAPLTQTLEEISPAETIETLPLPFFDDQIEFPNLESICIRQLQNLQKLWHDNLPLGSFHKLKRLIVEDCENLVAMFPSNIVERFRNLEMLLVYGCDSLEEIFRMVGGNLKRIDSAKSFQLRQLKIKGLPKMKHVWNRDPEGTLTIGKLEKMKASIQNLYPSSEGDYFLKDYFCKLFSDRSGMAEVIIESGESLEDSLVAGFLKRIEILHIESCHRVMDLFPVASALLHNLTELDIRYCDGLLYLMTSSAASSMVSLTRVRIVECRMIEVVEDNGTGSQAEISFPQLRHLGLHCLPNLESFSPTHCTLVFPSLEEVVVTQCPRMGIFCKGAISAPVLDKIQISENSEGCEGRWDGDLNTTIKEWHRYQQIDLDNEFTSFLLKFL